jgi:DNA-binding NtrC family response regulator
MTAANPVSIGMKSVSKEHVSRVLLIGREPQLSPALEEALAERNCIFRHAAGSADSLRQLRQAPYDVVITDPAISIDEDLALLSELQAIRPGVRVIVLAQESTPEEIIAALRARVFIVKSAPFDAEEIAEYACALARERIRRSGLKCCRRIATGYRYA